MGTQEEEGGNALSTKFTMKSIAVILAFCLVGLALCNDKRGFQRCASDNDCVDGCCLGGIFCMKHLQEGDLCAIRNAFGCGCAPGLECVQTGPIWQQCVKSGGSGGGPDF